MSGDFTAVIANGMASIKTSADAASKSVGGLGNGIKTMGPVAEKQFRDIGAAIARMGGPLGEIGGKLFGAAGMTGGIGKLALLATSAGLAMRGFSMYLELSERKAQAMAEATGRLSDQMKRAKGEANALAVSGQSLEGKLATANNLFGYTAEVQADELASAHGLDRGDIISGMARMGHVPAGRRVDLIRAAARAAQSGEGSVEDFAAMAAEPANQIRLQALGTQRGAARLVAMRRGSTTPAAIADAEAMLTYSPVYTPAAPNTSDIVSRAQLRDIASGKTRQVIRERDVRAADPATAAQADWYAAELERIEGLKRMAKAMAAVAEEQGASLTGLMMKWKVMMTVNDMRVAKVAMGYASGQAPVGTTGTGN